MAIPDERDTLAETRSIQVRLASPSRFPAGSDTAIPSNRGAAVDSATLEAGSISAAAHIAIAAEKQIRAGFMKGMMWDCIGDGSVQCRANLELLHDVVAAGFEEVDHHTESVQSSIIGVGDVSSVMHSGKVAEKVQLGLKQGVGSEHLVDHLDVGSVHSQDVIESLDVGGLDLAGRAGAEIAPVGKRLSHPVIGFFSSMIGDGPCGITVEIGRTGCLFDLVKPDRFGGRRTADVSHADKEDRWNG